MKGTIIFLREKNKGLSLRRVPKCGNREKWVFSDQGDSVVSFR